MKMNNIETKEMLTSIVLEVFKERKRLNEDTGKSISDDFFSRIEKKRKGRGSRPGKKSGGRRGPDKKTRKSKKVIAKTKQITFPGPSEWVKVRSISVGRKISVGDQEMKLVMDSQTTRGKKYDLQYLNYPDNPVLKFYILDAGTEEAVVNRYKKKFGKDYVVLVEPAQGQVQAPDLVLAYMKSKDPKNVAHVPQPGAKK